MTPSFHTSTPPEGKYIVIEGGDGTGKSTQITQLQRRLTEQGITSVVVHEPDATEVGAALRSILTNSAITRRPLTNALLFTAARHELYPDIEQHLTEGRWVISSRNWLSTIVYQGYGEGLNPDELYQLTKQATSDRYLMPDCTLILSLAAALRKQRIDTRSSGNATADTFETKGEDFQHKLDKGYITAAKTYHLPVINANQSIDAVGQEIWSHIAPLLRK